MVKQNRGTIQVNFYPDFIKQGGEEVGIKDVVDHVVYIGEKIGWDFVGFGSDFDGIETVPKGVEDVSKYPALIAELLNRGVSEEDCKKVAGRNVLRVWKEAEDVAREMQKNGAPILEDAVKQMKFAEAKVEL